MALFKIFRGPETTLNQEMPIHEGYAYFCEDTGHMFIDVSSVEGGRLQVNAYAAEILKGKDGETEIDVDDIFLTNMIAKVEQGGTGLGELMLYCLVMELNQLRWWSCKMEISRSETQRMVLGR